MGIIDKLFGTDPAPDRQPPHESQREPARSEFAAKRTDQQAIERYRYLLKTAPPEAIEQAHQEAFAQLSPEQRRMVLQQLGSDMADYEQGARVSQADDPQSLARMATRAEMRRPGTLERVFSGPVGSGQMGFGGLLAGSFMSSFAGMVIGSIVAQQFFSHDDHQMQDMGGGGDDQTTNDASGAEVADQKADAEMSGDGFADGDFGGGDFGGDFEV